MSGSGVTNFITFLQSQRDEDLIDAPASKLLTALQKVKLLPLPDVLDAAGVTALDAPNLVERLRTQGLVELVEEDGKADRFLRLTPRGFDKASGLVVP